MMWLLEDIVCGNPNIQRFKCALEQLKIPYQMIRVINDELVLMDNALLIPLSRNEEQLKSLLTRKDLFIYGGKSLLKAVTPLNLYPGAFSSTRFNYTELLKELTEELLNPDVQVDYIENLPTATAAVFVRPEGNTKYIDGKVYSKEAFTELRNALMEREQEKLVISSVKDIEAEYRLYVVGDTIVAASQYAPTLTETIEDYTAVESYAHKIMDRYPIDVPYVLDIAKTPMGYKVIEYNNLSTSGLYAVDVPLLIKAIERHYKGGRDF